MKNLVSMQTRKILELIQDTDHEVLEHAHAHTSKEASERRGTTLEQATKALVFSSEKGPFMCVVSGHKKVDTRKVKKILGVRNVTLANPDEVLSITGCSIGSVAPFPNLCGIQGFVDHGVLENKEIVFSAASHTVSVRMKPKDWLACSGTIIADIGK